MGRAFLPEQLVVGQPAEELHHLGFAELAAETVLEHREQLGDGLAARQDLEHEELPRLEVVRLVGQLVAQQVRGGVALDDAKRLQAARQVGGQRDFLGFTHCVFAFAVGAASGESLTLQPPPMAL